MVDPQTAEVAVIDRAELPDHGMRRMTVGKRQVLVCRLGESVFAVRANCPHRGAPLDEGRLEGPLLRCPWHGVKFDVRTGGRVCPPICSDLTVYEAEVRGDQVWIQVTDTAKEA